MPWPSRQGARSAAVRESARPCGQGSRRGTAASGLGERGPPPAVKPFESPAFSRVRGAIARRARSAQPDHLAGAGPELRVLTFADQKAIGHSREPKGPRSPGAECPAVVVETPALVPAGEIAITPSRRRGPGGPRQGAPIKEMEMKGCRNRSNRCLRAASISPLLPWLAEAHWPPALR